MGIVSVEIESARNMGKKPRSVRDSTGTNSTRYSGIPHLLTPREVADLLRTSKTAIYAMVERGQLPGVVRVGRRVLVRESDLLEWLTPELPPSPER
jgi:excisionase family DNA binding protein